MEKKDKYTSLCMRQNTFQFRGRYFSMGNPLSSLKFETELSNNPDFPRVWIRYVDDVYMQFEMQEK